MKSEKEKAVQLYLSLKDKEKKHWDKWGMRKPSPYTSKIDQVFIVLARNGWLEDVRNIQPGKE